MSGAFGHDRKNTGLLVKTFLETFNTPSKKKPALILKSSTSKTLVSLMHINNEIGNILDEVIYRTYTYFTEIYKTVR